MTVKRTVKHPAIIQVRGDYLRYIEEILKMLEKNCREFWVEKQRSGMDIYFSDVNDARRIISKIQKVKKAEIKMSTKYAGLRKGRVRVLFVFSLRF